MLALVFFGGCANVAFASAMLAGDVTRVMVLFYLLPAWGVLGARFWLKEPIDARRQLSLVFALLGAFCILGGPAIFASPPGFLDLVAVVSGLALALTNLIFRKEQQLPVTTKVSATFVGCLVWAGLIVAFTSDAMPVAVPGAVWAQVVGFGLVWILLATVGTLWGVHHMEAGRSSVLLSMELVTAVVSTAWLTGEHGTPLEWTGGGLILTSALLEAWPSARSA
jgi:drug/metabolite transporter (DMT)-like permease